jgi:hypothetical protein
MALAIGLGGIKEIDTKLDGMMNGLDGRGILGVAIGVGQPHGAITLARNP